MSEYQYHEWQTVDRTLTFEEQAAVNNLSSHIEVSSSRAVVTYNWSSFRHDPKLVLLTYFDGYFYFADWGSHRLMFRFPNGLLNEADILPYCIEDYIILDTSGSYQVLDLDFNPEDGGGWMDVRADLSYFIHLRADLLEGDFRLLYLAWLKAKTMYGDLFIEEYNGDEADNVTSDHEPPVPPGLKELSPSLQNFVQVFKIDPFLVQAAAEASPDLKKPLFVDYHELIGRLPRAECNDFLIRLAEGDPTTGLALRKRLTAGLPQDHLQPARHRTIQQLHKRAGQLKNAEKKRQAEAARLKHIAEMKALAAREAQVWQQVETLLDTGRRIASVYDEATQLLEKLDQLADFQDTRTLFQSRLRQLAQKYGSRPALISRWAERRWIY